jgi:hypothetical protein
MFPVISLSKLWRHLMSNQTGRPQVSARVDPEVLEALAAAAKADRRPVSNLIRNVLADWVEARSAGEQRAA